MEDDLKTKLWTGPLEWYRTWTGEDFIKKTLKNKILICLAWPWFELGAISDFFTNLLELNEDW